MTIAPATAQMIAAINMRLVILFPPPLITPPPVLTSIIRRAARTLAQRGSISNTSKMRRRAGEPQRRLSETADLAPQAHRVHTRVGRIAANQVGVQRDWSIRSSPRL